MLSSSSSFDIDIAAAKKMIMSMAFLSLIMHHSVSNVELVASEGGQDE